MKRVGGLAALAALMLAPGAAVAAPSGARKPVKLTSRTVVVSKHTVKKYLAGISKDGTTFKFRKSTGSLRKLKKGKVMLLKGRDVVTVAKVKHKRKALLVVTKPAKLTDVIKSGKITFKGKPNVRKAFLTRTVALPQKAKARAATTFEPPEWPYVGRPQGVLTANAADDGPSLSTQGSQGPFGYSLTFTPVSRTRINITGVMCFQWGSICSNGPSNGTSAEVTVSGYFDAGQEDVGITVDGGSVTHSSLSIKNIVGHAHMTYKIAHGQGGPTPNPPVFRVPIGVDYSIPGPYGVPLYFKLQTALLLNMGVDTTHATMQGGADVTTKGSNTITQDGKKVTTTQSGDKADLTILTGQSFTKVASGAIVTIQFPKIGAGLGVRAANGIGYIDLVTSVGQTTGTAFIGQICSAYDLLFSVGAGFEAQLGPLGIATPKKKLYEKKFSYDEPGCATG